MSTHTTQRPGSVCEGPAGRQGSVLVIVLILLLLGSFLGISLLYNTDVEYKSSKAYSDHLEALHDSDSAIHEVKWRLELEDKAAPAPTGSQVTVNNLSNYDARIDIDPQDVRDNWQDDDGDNRKDEFDELNLTYDWQTRILLSKIDPSPTWEVADTDIANGPPWGSHVAVPTIQPQASWREYTIDDVDSLDVLSVRFKLDTDTVLGDSEGDGPEVVYYDPALASNGDDDLNTLTGLGGDGDPSNDSGYHITWSDGTNTYQASGLPVLLVEATARINRGNGEAARQRVEVELTQNFTRLMDKALCGCEGATVSGGTTIDSYRSSEGNYGSGPVYDNGNVGSNGDMDINGTSAINGSVEASGNMTFAGNAVVVKGDATAGGTISGNNRTILGTETALVSPPPTPCQCGFDVVEAVAEAAADNDNASIVKCPSNPPLSSSPNLTNGIIVLSGGSYYFDSLRVGGSGEIRIGQDTDGDCVVDGPPLDQVRLYIGGEINIAGDGVVNDYSPMDLQIICSADATSTPPDDVYLGGTSEFRGSIYAPLAEVDLAGTNDFYGAAVGRTVRNVGGGPIHYDEELADSLLQLGSYRLLAWRTLVD